MAIFNSFLYVYQRVCHIDGFEYAVISNAYPMFTFGGWNLLSIVCVEHPCRMVPSWGL